MGLAWSEGAQFPWCAKWTHCESLDPTVESPWYAWSLFSFLWSYMTISGYIVTDANIWILCVVELLSEVVNWAGINVSRMLCDVGDGHWPLGWVVVISTARHCLMDLLLTRVYYKGVWDLPCVTAGLVVGRCTVRISLVGFLHAWRGVDWVFPREAEGGVRCVSRRIVLDRDCVFRNKRYV